MPSKPRISAVLAATLLLALALVAQTTAPADSHSTAVNGLRLLNTAQMQFHMQHGRFASLSDLPALLDATTPSYRASMPHFDPAAGKDALAGFELGIATNDNGYTITLKETKPCGAFAYSDQVGVIFLGKALGCND
jgi:hypothetical protein